MKKQLIITIFLIASALIVIFSFSLLQQDKPPAIVVNRVEEVKPNKVPTPAIKINPEKTVAEVEKKVNVEKKKEPEKIGKSEVVVAETSPLSNITSLSKIDEFMPAFASKNSFSHEGDFEQWNYWNENFKRCNLMESRHLSMQRLSCILWSGKPSLQKVMMTISGEKLYTWKMEESLNAGIERYAYFRHFNGKFFKWAKLNVLPILSNETNRSYTQKAYDKFIKYEARYFLSDYIKIINMSEAQKNELMEKFLSIVRLKEQIANPFSAEQIPHFWMRRILDGSFNEIGELLKAFMDIFDAEFVTSLSYDHDIETALAALDSQQGETKSFQNFNNTKIGKLKSVPDGMALYDPESHMYNDCERRQWNDFEGLKNEAYKTYNPWPGKFAGELVTLFNPKTKHSCNALVTLRALDTGYYIDQDFYLLKMSKQCKADEKYTYYAYPAVKIEKNNNDDAEIDKEVDPGVARNLFDVVIEQLKEGNNMPRPERQSLSPEQEKELSKAIFKSATIIGKKGNTVQYLLRVESTVDVYTSLYSSSNILTFIILQNGDDIEVVDQTYQRINPYIDINMDGIIDLFYAGSSLLLFDGSKLFPIYDPVPC